MLSTSVCIIWYGTFHSMTKWSRYWSLLYHEGVLPVQPCYKEKGPCVFHFWKPFRQSNFHLPCTCVRNHLVLIVRERMVSPSSGRVPQQTTVQHSTRCALASAWHDALVIIIFIYLFACTSCTVHHNVTTSILWPTLQRGLKICTHCLCCVYTECTWSQGHLLFVCLQWHLLQQWHKGVWTVPCGMHWLL